MLSAGTTPRRMCGSLGSLGLLVALGLFAFSSACSSTPQAPATQPITATASANQTTRESSAVTSYAVSTDSGTVTLKAEDAKHDVLATFEVRKLPGIQWVDANVPSMVVVMDGTGPNGAQIHAEQMSVYARPTDLSRTELELYAIDDKNVVLRWSYSSEGMPQRLSMMTFKGTGDAATPRLRQLLKNPVTKAAPDGTTLDVSDAIDVWSTTNGLDPVFQSPLFDIAFLVQRDPNWSLAIVNTIDPANDALAPNGVVGGTSLGKSSIHIASEGSGDDGSGSDATMPPNDANGIPNDVDDAEPNDDEDPNAEDDDPEAKDDADPSKPEAGGAGGKGEPQPKAPAAPKSPSAPKPPPAPKPGKPGQLGSCAAASLKGFLEDIAKDPSAVTSGLSACNACSAAGKTAASPPMAALPPVDAGAPPGAAAAPPKSSPQNPGSQAYQNLKASGSLVYKPGALASTASCSACAKFMQKAGAQHAVSCLLGSAVNGALNSILSGLAVDVKIKSEMPLDATQSTHKIASQWASLPMADQCTTGVKRCDYDVADRDPTVGFVDVCSADSSGKQVCKAVTQ